MSRELMQINFDFFFPYKLFFFQIQNDTGYCVSCEPNGQFFSEYQCLGCDSSCTTCSGALSNQCLSCYSGTYLLSNNTGKYCQPRVPVSILKFELKEAPLLYLLELDTAVYLEASIVRSIRLRICTISRRFNFIFTLENTFHDNEFNKFVMYLFSKIEIFLFQ